LACIYSKNIREFTLINEEMWTLQFGKMKFRNASYAAIKKCDYLFKKIQLIDITRRDVSTKICFTIGTDCSANPYIIIRTSATSERFSGNSSNGTILFHIIDYILIDRAGRDPSIAICFNIGTHSRMNQYRIIWILLTSNRF
jgi:hypothetical protein